VAEKMQWLREILERRRSVELSELLCDLATRLDRIATFLAVLELIRMREIVAYQKRTCAEIRVALREEPAATAGQGARR
jgi:chromatin segregation and condensation protein Rec8/ScpA/Scc1 (kleisin family)